MPQLGPDDIAQMLREAAPIARWALQSYHVPPSYKSEDAPRIHAPAPTPAQCTAALQAAAPYVAQATYRGAGTPGGASGINIWYNPL